MSDAAKSAPERVLVSACLLGRRCRYDGSENRDRVLERELEARGAEIVPYCPEEAGGLGTPRPAAWLGASAEDVLDGRARVTTDAGRDVTEAFLRGARGAAETCKLHGIRAAFLKERSPSCGVLRTHVDGALADGPGVTAALLAREGVRPHGVEGRRE